MALWLPIGLFVIGAFATYIVCDALDDPAAAGFMAGLFFIAFFGTVAVLVSGTYFWLKTGQWKSISGREGARQAVRPRRNGGELALNSAHRGHQFEVPIVTHIGRAHVRLDDVDSHVAVHRDNHRA